MRKVSSLIVLLALLFLGKLYGQHTLVFQITGLEHYPSTVAFEVLDAEGLSLLQGFRRVASEGDTIAIEAPLASSVAVQAYEDRNRNKKMDMGFFGQPLERYAFSNNAWQFLSKPKLEDQLIKLEHGHYKGTLHFKSVLEP